MKKMILILVMGLFFFSCNNDDEPSNRDLLNGRHWILKEVDSGPFGYYDDLYSAIDFASERIFIRNFKLDSEFTPSELWSVGYAIFILSLVTTSFLVSTLIYRALHQWLRNQNHQFNLPAAASSIIIYPWGIK